MHEKDVVSKHLLKRIALDMARLLLHLDVDDVELLETQSQRVEERRADLLVRASGNDGSFLLHIEVQNANHSAMPWRMLRYRADAALQYPGCEVRQYLLYIGRDTLAMADGIVESGLDYRFRIVDMHSIDCSVNRDLQAIIQEEAAMLSQVRYSDLPSFHLGMEQGMEQGIQQGIQRGMQQGMQQGESAMLLSLLESKFGALTAETRRKVENADATTLLAWSRRLLAADSLEAVFH